MEPSDGRLEWLLEEQLQRQMGASKGKSSMEQQRQQPATTNKSNKKGNTSKLGIGNTKSLPPTAVMGEEIPGSSVTENISEDDVAPTTSSTVDKTEDESEAEHEELEKQRRLIIDKVNIKYPHVATEILVSAVGKTYILPKIVETPADQILRQADMELDKQQSHLDHLFSFIEQVTPLPQHLVGHFIKVTITMIKAPPLTSKIMNHIYSDEGRLIKCLVKHVNTTDEICELLLMCLLYERSESSGGDDDDATSDDSDTDNNSITSNSYINSISDLNTSDWTVKQSILSVLVSLLLTEPYCENVSAIVSTILTLPRPSMLISELVKAETVSQIVDNLIASADSTDVFSEGIDFLGTMITASEQGDESAKVLFDNLHRFVDLLNNPASLDSIMTTWGVLERPLGVCRLKIIEFFVIVFKDYEKLSQRHPEIDIGASLRHCGILPACVNLFFEFEQNNVLHNLVTHIITYVLESGFTEFIEILFDVKTNLVTRIIDAYNKNKIVQRETRQSLAYMGHITIIENFLNNLEVEEYRQELQAVEGWQQVSDELRDKHFIECIYRHGGNIGLPSSYMKTQFGIEDGDEDTDDEDDTYDETDDEETDENSALADDDNSEEGGEKENAEEEETATTMEETSFKTDKTDDGEKEEEEQEEESKTSEKSSHDVENCDEQQAGPTEIQERVEEAKETEEETNVSASEVVDTTDGAEESEKQEKDTDDEKSVAPVVEDEDEVEERPAAIEESETTSAEEAPVEDSPEDSSPQPS